MQGGGWIGKKGYKMDIQDFKSRIDIVRVVEQFLPLRREGAFYKANCPFHSEKTASFIVNANKGFFHCFGCNKGGDAIKFIQELKNLTFKEAVEEVAKIENIELNFGKNYRAEFDFLKDLNEYFKKGLNEKAMQFNTSRGLDEEDIFEFEIGFTGDIESLIRFLKGKDYINLAKKLGYIKEKDGQFFSMFSNRLSFCIKDSLGRVRGFSTRELYPNSKLGKYVNSLKSDFFNKSFLLYNFDKAKDYARIQKSLIICEGFYDAIALHKSGFKNAVASCGTAFTLSHLSLIKRLNIENLKLIFVPDKDEAGYEAVAKALRMCFENEFFNIEVAVCKKSIKDAGDFMKNFKNESLKDFLHYYDGLEFYTKYRLKKTSTSEAKHTLFLELKKLVEQGNNFYLKRENFKKLSLYLDIPENAFYQKKAMKKTQNEQERQLKQIIKTALMDDEFKERVLFFAKKYLGKYEEALQNGEILSDIECDECLEPFGKEKQNEALKAFILSNLYKERESCKDSLRLEVLANEILKMKGE